MESGESSQFLWMIEYGARPAHTSDNPTRTISFCLSKISAASLLARTHQEHVFKDLFKLIFEQEYQKNTEDLETIKQQAKANIRAILISTKEALPLPVFLRDHNTLVGSEVPWRKLGYRSLRDFLNDIPDVVQVLSIGKDYYLQGVANAETEHVQKLVCLSKTSRKSRHNRCAQMTFSRYEASIKKLVPVAQPAPRSASAHNTDFPPRYGHKPVPSQTVPPSPLPVEFRPKTAQPSESFNSIIPSAPAAPKVPQASPPQGQFMPKIPQSCEPLDFRLPSTTTVPQVPNKIVKNVLEVLRYFPNGIKTNEFKAKYETCLGCIFDFEMLGFGNIFDFFEELKPTVRIQNRGNGLWIIAGLMNGYQLEHQCPDGFQSISTNTVHRSSEGDVVSQSKTEKPTSVKPLDPTTPPFKPSHQLDSRTAPCRPSDQQAMSHPLSNLKPPPALTQPSVNHKRPTMPHYQPPQLRQADAVSNLPTFRTNINLNFANSDVQFSARPAPPSLQSSNLFKKSFSDIVASNKALEPSSSAVQHNIIRTAYSVLKNRHRLSREEMNHPILEPCERRDFNRDDEMNWSVLGQDLGKFKRGGDVGLLNAPCKIRKTGLDEELGDKCWERLIANLHLVLQEHPNGLKIENLESEYKRLIGTVLKVEEYGSKTVKEFIGKLSNVFITFQPNCESSLLLFDANPEVPEDVSHGSRKTDAEKLAISRDELVVPHVSASEKGKLYNFLRKFPDGIPYADFLLKYKKFTGDDLNIKEFQNLEDFLLSLSPAVVELKYGTAGIQVYASKNLCIPPNERALPSEEEKLANLYLPDAMGLDDNLPNESIPYPDKKNPLYLTVSVSEIYNPSRFYFIKADTYIIDNLLDEMDLFYNGKEGNKYKMPEPTILVGQICAAYFDKHWHRVRITAFHNKFVYAICRDFATRMQVRPEDLRFLKKKFASHPAQSIRGKLTGLKPANGAKKWSQEACVFFLEYCNEHKHLVAWIKDYDERTGILDVGLYNTEEDADEYLNRILRQKGFADADCDLTDYDFYDDSEDQYSHNQNIDPNCSAAEQLGPESSPVPENTPFSESLTKPKILPKPTDNVWTLPNALANGSYNMGQGNSALNQYFEYPYMVNQFVSQQEALNVPSLNTLFSQLANFNQSFIDSFTASKAQNLSGNTVGNACSGPGSETQQPNLGSNASGPNVLAEDNDDQEDDFMDMNAICDELDSLDINEVRFVMPVDLGNGKLINIINLQDTPFLTSADISCLIPTWKGEDKLNHMLEMKNCSLPSQYVEREKMTDLFDELQRYDVPGWKNKITGQLVDKIRIYKLQLVPQILALFYSSDCRLWSAISMQVVKFNAKDDYWLGN